MVLFLGPFKQYAPKYFRKHKRGGAIDYPGTRG